jgi:hypothetical protein
MKIYLAARYQRLNEVVQYAHQLQKLGHTVDCRWLLGLHQLHPKAETVDGLSQDEVPMEALPFAQDDIEDVQKCSILVLFTEKPFSDKGRGGRHVEFGLALGLGKTVVIVGPRENIFHCLPGVIQFRTFGELLKQIQTVKSK